MAYTKSVTVSGNKANSSGRGVQYANFDTNAAASSTFDLKVLCNDFSKITDASFLLQDSPNRMRQAWFMANKLGGSGYGQFSFGLPSAPDQKPTNWVQGNQFWWNGRNPLLLGVTTNTPVRSSTNCMVGMRFTVGSSNIITKYLGRWVLPNSAGSSTVYLTDSNKNPLRSVTVNIAGQKPGTFAYAELDSYIILYANTVYYLLSSETAYGDAWCMNCPVGAGSGAIINSAVYGNVETAGAICNGPLNFTSCMIEPRVGSNWITNGSGSTNLGINNTQQYKINNPSEFSDSRFSLY